MFYRIDADQTAGIVPRSITRRTPAGAIDLTWTAATDNVGVTGYKLYRGNPHVGRYGVAPRPRQRHELHRRCGGDGDYLLLRSLGHRRRGQRVRKSTRSSRSRLDNTPPPSPVATVDAGFESGHRRRRSFASPPWTASGAPQRREYDTARAKVGTKSAWIQGAAAGDQRRRLRDAPPAA